GGGGARARAGERAGRPRRAARRGACLVRAHRRPARSRRAHDEAPAPCHHRFELGAGDHAGGVRRAGLLHHPRPPRRRAGAGVPRIESPSRHQGGAMADEPTKYQLTEREIPTHWINLLGDLPGDPLPPLHPGTRQPAGPDDLAPLFPMGLIQQEVSPEPEIEIPAEVREVYRLWRPTPLYRARRLEAALKTPAHIYYKYEGVSPPGSHKPNTAVAQAYENARAGVKKLATETGAGQWGSALAFACQLFGLECEVFMVGSSYDQKPYRRTMMETWGATVHRSPSDRTEGGRAQAEHTTGSLGIA